MNVTEILNLVDRYLKKARAEEETPLKRQADLDEQPISEEEAAIVENSFYSFASKAEDYAGTSDHTAAGQEIWDRLNIPLKPQHSFPFIKYAAVLAAVVGITWGYYTINKHQTNKQELTASKILPGGNRAILTLANGTEISLNTQSGSLAATSPVQGLLISNNADSGIVSFTSTGKQEGNNNHDIAKDGGTNTITTPRAGKYRLKLPDGTDVYLNAASTIKFPSRFVGKTRTVSIIGEAYFEVAKDPDHPFIVNSDQQQLKVLGTHFNVSAYPGEDLKTTLAEGRVLLTNLSNGISQPLMPEQQSLLLPSTQNGFIIKNVSPDDEIAWIHGKFVFSGTSIKEAMQQISRWYDIEVDYDSLPDERLEASLSRNLSLADVLEIIEYNGKYKFTLQGRRLIFLKK